MKRAILVSGLLLAGGVFTACNNAPSAAKMSSSAVKADEVAQSFGVAYYERATGTNEFLKAFNAQDALVGVLRVYRNQGEGSTRLIFEHGGKQESYDVDQV